MRASRWVRVSMVAVGVAVAGVGGCSRSSGGAEKGAGRTEAQAGGGAAAEEQRQEKLPADVTVDTQKIDVPHSTIDTTAEETEPAGR